MKGILNKKKASFKPRRLTLVIDQGTFATRALALDEEGNVRASAFCRINLQRLGADRVEQGAEEILRSMHQVIKALLEDDGIQRLDFSRAGLATQRSSVVAWDTRTGKPLGPVLSWQDRRAAEWLSRLNGFAAKVKTHTGLPLSPHYGASKLRWCLDHLPSVKQAYHDGCLAFGPLAGFILFHLLQENPLLVDHANASRTLLWNIQTRNWDPWLLELFGISLETLPQCRPICTHYGILKNVHVPLTAVNGDQTSAIYGFGRPGRHTAIVNMGTGAFILISTGKKQVSHAALLSGLSSSGKDFGEYVLEGTVNGAGAALEWAADEWHMPDMIPVLSEGFSQKGDIPIFLNTIGGLGSPWWRSGPTPKIIGDGAPWQKAIAVAESILFLLEANLDAMRHAGFNVKRIQVSGGLARMNGICQRLADLAQIPLYRPAETEATARGIAWLASGCPKHWPKPGRGRYFEPRENDSLHERYKTFCQLLETS